MLPVQHLPTWVAPTPTIDIDIISIHFIISDLSRSFQRFLRTHMPVTSQDISSIYLKFSLAAVAKKQQKCFAKGLAWPSLTYVNIKTYQNSRPNGLSREQLQESLHGPCKNDQAFLAVSNTDSIPRLFTEMRIGLRAESWKILEAHAEKPLFFRDGCRSCRGDQ